MIPARNQPKISVSREKLLDTCNKSNRQLLEYHTQVILFAVFKYV